MEEAAKQLRESRSSLKRDITLCSNKLSTAIKRNQSIDSVSNKLEVLDDLFEKFSAVHLEYEDLLSNSSDLDSYRTVNNLSMSEYFCEVEKSFENASSAAIEYQQSFHISNVKVLESDLVSSLSDIEYYTDLIGKLPSSAISYRNEREMTCVYFDEADKIVLTVTGKLKSFKAASAKISYDCSETCKTVESCIAAINKKIVECKARAMTQAHFINTGLHIDQNNTLSPTQTLTPPCKPSIILC
jgi:hypothetical protein